MIDNNKDKAIEPIVIDSKKSVVKKTGQIINIGTVNLIVRPVQRRYEEVYQSRTWHLLIDLFGIVGIIVIFSALVFFWNHPLTSNKYIDFEFHYSPQQVSGQTSEYTITFHNNNRAIIEDAYITLLPPVGWQTTEVISSNYKYDADTNTITLGDLLPGSNNMIKVVGQIWADIDKGADWEVRFYYKNLGILHNKTITLNIPYNSSLLTTSWQLPAEIFSANKFDLIFTIKNNSNSDLSNIVTKLYSPSGFRLLNSDDFSWTIARLAARDESTINLTAVIDNLNSSDLELGLETILQFNQSLLKQSWIRGASQFIKPKIDLDINSYPKESIDLNQTYSLQIYYYNRENFSLKNVNVSVLATANGLKFNPLTKINNIKQIDSREESFIDYKFNFERGRETVSPTVTLQTVLSWTENTDNTTRYIYSKPITINIKPSLHLTAQLYYFTPSGDQLGYGPIPPVVERETSYWISMHLWPTFGNLKDVELTADFGDGVKLLDYNSSIGEVFNKEGIRWTIEKYDDNNFNQPEPRLNLQLVIKPSVDMTGELINLLSNIKASAVNLADNKQSEIQIDNITTDMRNDSWLANDGRVVNN